VGSLDVIRHLHWPAEGDYRRPAVTPADSAAARVRGPALALLLVGVLHSAVLPAVVVSGLLPLWGSDEPSPPPLGAGHNQLASAGRPDVAAPLFAQKAARAPEPPLAVRSALLALLPSVILGPIIIIGAVCLLRLHSRGWASAAAILALMPCGPAWVIGLPVGIWALAVLTEPGVKAAFGRG
jgi:hypothetical protein